jgi:hypothetical protein
MKVVSFRYSDRQRVVGVSLEVKTAQPLALRFRQQCPGLLVIKPGKGNPANRDSEKI